MKVVIKLRNGDTIVEHSKVDISMYDTKLGSYLTMATSDNHIYQYKMSDIDNFKFEQEK